MCAQLVISTFLYILKSWILTADPHRCIEYFEMYCVIYDDSNREHIKNEGGVRKRITAALLIKEKVRRYDEIIRPGKKKNNNLPGIVPEGR